jgi:hypothetical protein
LQHMRIILIAAVALLFVGATRETPQGIPGECAFNLPLSPAQCGRLLGSAHRRAGRSWTARSNQTLVYASQLVSSSVAIYTVGAKGFKATGALALASGSFPLGLTVDGGQNLYVAISSLGSGTPSVDVFPRGATQPSKVYTDGLTGPIDVAVDRHGTLYVANLANPGGGGCGQGSGPGGSVVEYANGSMTPTATIADFPGCPNGIAVDSKANLYLTYLYYPATGFVQSDVRKYAYQSTNGQELNLQVPGGPFLGGIAVTRNGDIVVENSQADATLNQILTFSGGSKQPSSTIQYGGVGWGTGFKYFALLGNQIFAPAYIAESLGFIANTPAEFDYPSGRQRFAENPALTSSPISYGFAASP